MAVLSFYINEKSKDRVEVKLEKHNGESENDLSYKWGKYALSLAIQLNFNEIKVNPFSEDQGARIHFLSEEIRQKNELNIYGYIKEDDEFFDDEDEYYDDEDDYMFETSSNSSYEHKDFEDDFNGAAYSIKNDKDAVQIALDLHEATKIVGGLLTPSAVSANAVYEGCKQHSKELFEAKIDQY